MKVVLSLALGSVAQAGGCERKDILLTEFVVEVYPKKVEWDGLERFILTLLKQRPEGGYDRAIKEARYRARRVRP